jgi:peptide/nickel transport system permease protein
MFVGLTAGLASMLIGGTAGIIAGYYGGRVDSLVGRVTEFFLVMPELILMALFAALLGPSLLTITGVITLLLWTGTALIIRAQVKSIRERVYVKRARSIGASNRRIMMRHVLPQVAPLMIANTILVIAVAIFDETFLAFLGLGDPSTVSLGRMIEFAFDDSAASRGAWWTLVPPGIVVTLIILGLTMMGQALEDALNPRLKVSYLSVRSFLVRKSVTGQGEAS